MCLIDVCDFYFSRAFGELKAVRLPKKLVGQEKHRGFGFVEYYTKSDSKRAFKALCQSTHLYGRRLVLEWAQAIEDVDDIRKRTAKHFHQESSSKRSKKAALDPESVGLATE
uniref:RBM19_0 protein n=1 Tax=Fopius arisanus TaxID=64838 RepID=A0A0C9RHT5_9HYME